MQDIRERHRLAHGTPPIPSSTMHGFSQSEPRPASEPSVGVLPAAESREDRPCLASIMIRAKSWTNHPGLIIASYVTACSSTATATAGPLRLSCLAHPAACDPSLRRTKLSLAVTALAWHKNGMHGRLTSKTAAFLRAYRQ